MNVEFLLNLTYLIQYLENEPTEIFIVNMKTGHVEKMEAETVFSQHHINAFETSGKDGTEIVLDISPSSAFGLRYLFQYQKGKICMNILGISKF